MQEAQEARHMAMIVPEVGFAGLLVRVEFLRVEFLRIGLFRKRFVLVVVMTEVLAGFPWLVPAMVNYRSPGYLEREQTEHDEHKKTSHDGHKKTSHDGQHYSYFFGFYPSMLKWVRYPDEPPTSGGSIGTHMIHPSHRERAAAIPAATKRGACAPAAGRDRHRAGFDGHELAGAHPMPCPR